MVDVEKVVAGVVLVVVEAVVVVDVVVVVVDEAADVVEVVSNSNFRSSKLMRCWTLLLLSTLDLIWSELANPIRSSYGEFEYGIKLLRSPMLGSSDNRGLGIKVRSRLKKI